MYKYGLFRSALMIIYLNFWPTAAPAFIKKPKGTVAKSGTNVTFPATFTGNPQPKVVWTKNDEEIKSEGRYNISTTEGASSLQIFKVSKSDNGWYKIALSNPSGWAWASAQLLVTGTLVLHFTLTRQNQFLVH